MTDEPQPDGLQLHPPVMSLATPAPAPAPARPTGPIPMSMPAILQNPRLKHIPTSRVVRTSSQPQSQASKDVSKRKARRAENARMAGNPHIVRPSAADFRLHANPRQPTFEGLPPSALGPNQEIPAYGSVRARAPAYDASSAAFGQFSLSLREARKVLSQLQEAGPTQRLVAKARDEISAWLAETVFLNPGKKDPRVLVDIEFNTATATATATADGDAGQLVEIQRTPNALVWAVPDAYLRLAVHCLARVSGCPSFSKDSPQRDARHTWILNPNPLARRRRTRAHSATSSTASGLHNEAARHATLETPPTTDLESRASEDEASSYLDTEDEDAEPTSNNSAAHGHVHQWRTGTGSALQTPLEEEEEEEDDDQDDRDDSADVTAVPHYIHDSDSDWAADHEDAESVDGFTHITDSFASLPIADRQPPP